MTIAIIGGGISGMYLAHLLSKERQSCILIDSKKHLGGRIDTYKGPHLTGVEAGAGRFLLSHKRLIRLLKELHLYDKCEKITTPSTYIPQIGSSDAIPTKSHIDNLMHRVIHDSKRRSYDSLRKITFMDHVKTVLNPKDAKLLYDSFGYSTEFTVMNAYDAVEMIENHLAKRNFYHLSGGLSQIIERLEQKLVELPYVTILRKCPIENIVERTSTSSTTYILHGRESGFMMEVDQCICAVPVPIMRKWSALASIHNSLDSIVCAPLCRIYSVMQGASERYPVKFATDTDIKMYIPISGDVAMISYTDNDYAKKWKGIHDEGGTLALNRELRKELVKTLGAGVPMPRYTKMFYWGCGVGYWGLNADTRNFRLKVKQGLYICGENVSALNQQWMEGALDTAEQVFRQITY